MNDRKKNASPKACMRAARLLVLAGVLAMSGPAVGADMSAWRWQQTLEVPQPGLIKIELPPETLDAAREDQRDLRIMDGQGDEVPYLIDQSEHSTTVVEDLRELDVAVLQGVTVLVFTNRLDGPLESVSIETPAPSFNKSVSVEIAEGARDYVIQSAGQLLFRQSSGAQRTLLKLQADPGARVRLTFDDTRSDPIPLTSLQLQGAAAEEVAPRDHPVTLVRREEEPGESRLLLQFGARHVLVANLSLTVTDAVFARQVSLISRVIEDDQIKEQVIAGATISRSIGPDTAPGQLLSVEARIPQRELWLSIRNEDSPPLTIDGVRATVRPAFLVCQTGAAGTFTFHAGNPGVSAPTYDISRLRSQLQGVALADLKLGPRKEHPGFRPTETLADVPLLGPEVDVSGWTYRKDVWVTEDGIQELELDAEVLAHARPGLPDLRLLQSGRQVPYLVERSASTRPVYPEIAPETDAENPSVQRWKLALPVEGLPVNQLKAVAETSLFQRDVHLYERPVDGRGASYRRNLGNSRWTRVPAQKQAAFRLMLDAAPLTDVMILEVDNGDNPPLVLHGFELTHAVVRVLFKAAAGDQLELYYGQPEARRPRYDLTLMGRQVLEADRQVASLGPEIRLRGKSWRETAPVAGIKGVVFWTVLILVVAGLLVIIARLLPRQKG